MLLKLSLTLPITSCESERSFSQLKLIKTPLRATTTDNRLNGLAIMKLNRDKCDKIQLQHLVKSFSMLHPRRMKLPFLLDDIIMFIEFDLPNKVSQYLVIVSSLDSSLESKI